jgi:hypothetical protein
LRITPYRTSDNKIEGAVLVLLETTEFKHGAAEAAKGKSKS